MDVDVRNPEVQRELLAQYRRLREVAKRLNQTLVESVDQDAIHESGRRLGILRRGVLVFDSEDMMSVLMDYAIHHYLSGDGRNAVRRYLDLSPPAPGTEEYAVLQARTNLRYGLFQVAGVFRGFGIEMDDLLRDERLLVIDIGLSSTARRGFVLASNVVCYGSFWTTTGAGLPVSADVLKELFGATAKAFGANAEAFLALDPARQADLAAMVIRVCLQRGMGEHVGYDDPGSHPRGPHFGRAPEHALGPTGLVAARSQQRHERQNAPCPCGSGRKYKNCCGRR